MAKTEQPLERGYRGVASTDQILEREERPCCLAKGFPHHVFYRVVVLFE